MCISDLLLDIFQNLLVKDVVNIDGKNFSKWLYDRCYLWPGSKLNIVNLWTILNLFRHVLSSKIIILKFIKISGVG